MLIKPLLALLVLVGVALAGLFVVVGLALVSILIVFGLLGFRPPFGLFRSHRPGRRWY